jgi:hypothetical protein
MRAKASGLLQYAGLDPAAAARLCDSVLDLPSAASCPPLLTDLLRHAGID